MPRKKASTDATIEPKKKASATTTKKKASTVERTNYVLDTSVLAYHGESIHMWPDENVIIPMEVMEELDNLKTRMDIVGASCRYVNKYLDKVREKGNISKGIELDNKQVITVSSDSDMKYLPKGMTDINDNRIISVAKKLLDEGKKVVLVSRDIALRVKCDALDIPAITYEKNGSKGDHLFDGVINVEVSKDEIELFYQEGILELYDQEFLPNQGLVLRCGQSSALAMAKSKHVVKRLKYAVGKNGGKGVEIEGISPRNAEQTIALELLLDPEVHMVSLTGMAGSGKTLLSIAAAVKMLQSKQYKKLVISRPAQSTSKEIGFLPGNLQEKMAPWLQPIFDNLEVIFESKGMSYINMMLDKGIIQMEALTYIRGRTLPDTIFVIDEAQNISHHEAKAVLTRMGENSKIILIGDLEQIDSPSLDQKTSGLSSVVDLFKEFEYSGHVRLKKGERSKLATYAAKVM